MLGTKKAPIIISSSTKCIFHRILCLMISCLPFLWDVPEATFFFLLMSLGPCHHSRPMFMPTDRTSFSNNTRDIVMPSQLLCPKHGGHAIFHPQCPFLVYAFFVALSRRIKSPKDVHSQPGWRPMSWSSIKHTLNRVMITKTNSYPVGFGREAFGKSSARNKRVNIQSEASPPWQWSGESPEGKSNCLGFSQSSCFICRISLK